MKLGRLGALGPVGLLVPLFASATLVAPACGTGNGDEVHGPTFGDLGDRDGSSPDGSSGRGDASTERPDADAPDGPEAGPLPCASGSVAVLAGGDSSLTAAVQDKGGSFSSAAVMGGSAASKPGLVAFGAGFLGVTRGSGDRLLSTAYAGSWSAAATIGVAGVKGPPALAVTGAKAHVVYSAGPGANTDFTHGVYDGSWDDADETVGAPKSFGTVGAGLGAAGATAVFVENGTDHKLYARVYDGSWSASTEIAGAASIGNDLPAPPAVVSSTGSVDLVAVYVQQTTRRLSYATRDATSKTWQDRGVVHMLATTDEAFSAARVGTTTFLVAFRGQDGKGYYAQGLLGGGGAIAWAAAQPVGGAAAVVVDSTPAVAKGVCGDDAVFAYATGGAVSITRLRGASWTTPETVPGLAGTRVAIATR